MLNRWSSHNAEFPFQTSNEDMRIMKVYVIGDIAIMALKLVQLSAGSWEGYFHKFPTWLFLMHGFTGLKAKLLYTEVILTKTHVYSVFLPTEMFADSMTSMQFDTHQPFTTVHEALQFSAHLRFDTATPSDTIEQFILEVMKLVELDSLSNALVGRPGVSGLSVEQRKRLTISVELVANPSIVFMDEPTSGAPLHLSSCPHESYSNESCSERPTCIGLSQATWLSNSVEYEARCPLNTIKDIALSMHKAARSNHW